VAGALDLLDEEVQALGGAGGGAGGMAGEDLTSPAGERQPKAAHFADGVQPAAFDRLVKEDLGLGDALGQVDVALPTPWPATPRAPPGSDRRLRSPRSMRSRPVPSRRSVPESRSFRIR